MVAAWLPAPFLIVELVVSSTFFLLLPLFALEFQLTCNPVINHGFAGRDSADGPTYTCLNPVPLACPGLAPAPAQLALPSDLFRQVLPAAAAVADAFCPDLYPCQGWRSLCSVINFGWNTADARVLCLTLSGCSQASVSETLCSTTLLRVAISCCFRILNNQIFTWRWIMLGT